VFVVEKLGVELDPKDGLRGVLHGLDGASLVGRCEAEIRWQFFDLVAVGMPHDYGCREVPEDSVSLSARQFHREKPALAKRPFVAFAGSRAPHQRHGSVKGDGDLLVPSTDSQDWLASLADNFKHAGERFRLIIVPGMTLAAENDVTGLCVGYELRGDVPVGFENDIQIGADS